MWDRKEAVALADAISHRRMTCSENIEQNQLFACIGKDVATASQTDMTDAGRLERLRLRVCELCRANKMYDCDVPQGWTSRCSFLKANTV